jgi:hypothetical protein
MCRAWTLSASRWRRPQQGEKEKKEAGDKLQAVSCAELNFCSRCARACGLHHSSAQSLACCLSDSKQQLSAGSGHSPTEGGGGLNIPGSFKAEGEREAGG